MKTWDLIDEALNLPVEGRARIIDALQRTSLIKPGTTRSELGRGAVRNLAALAVEKNAEKIEPPFDAADVWSCVVCVQHYIERFAGDHHDDWPEPTTAANYPRNCQG